MIQLFINTHDDIFKAVKRESSYLAERKSKEGDSMFDELVYDEEYEIQFKEQFLEARSKVIETTLAYSKNIELLPAYLDTQDFDMEKDFVLYLEISDNFPAQMLQPTLIKIKEALVSHILYRWFENKIPEAEIYLNKHTQAIKDIKSYLEKRIKPYRRTGRLF